MGDLDFDTRLRGGDGRYQATLSEDWRIWGPNGGSLAAIALRAAARSGRPVSFTATSWASAPSRRPASP